MPYTPLASTRVLLGISGGIAAYKMIEVARLLRQAGARVDVLLTEAAEQFVTPLTFETLTRQPVRRDVFQQWTEQEAGHVTLAEQADVFVIAPATANVIAKLAHGLADDMLTVSALATPGPVLVAPAMDHHMYLNAATQANLKILAERGIEILGPDQGELASGIIGHGRLVSPEVIFGMARQIVGRQGPLAGKHVVVSSGATREPLDPIRFLTNRSTGRMGHAVAQAAIDAGARTTLVTAPTNLAPPVGAEVVDVESAGEMYDAVGNATSRADALIMAAAVGDYTPRDVSEQKIKKSDQDLTLHLSRTVDILASINRPGMVKVGFAAETDNLREYASRKLRTKGVDLLVANDATLTMGSAENQAVLFRPDAEPLELDRMPKEALAARIIDEVFTLLTHGERPETRSDAATS
ncbi:MAG: bifunctional phosphopantothenoylcysteine decarboxylase/phosphopantothenate--cysteine ligase CoaBC [Chloroflexota bacterium]